MIIIMPTPFFGLNFQDGTTPQVKLYNGTQTSPVGVSFGVLDSGVTSTAEPRATNRVIQFGSNNIFYATVGNQVYRTTDGGASWTSVYTLAALAVNQSTKTGLFLPYINGVPHLALFWKTTGTSETLSGAVSSNGTTWTSYGPVFMGTPTGAPAGGFYGGYMYRNKIFTVRPGSTAVAAVFSFDPGSGAFSLNTVATMGTTNREAADFCEFNGNLLLLFKLTGGTANLAVLGGGSFANVITSFVGVGVAATGGKSGMLVDGSNLYCFLYATALLGWKCFEVSSTYIATDITSTVIPIGMTGSTSGGNSAADSRVFLMVDQEATPGANPNKYLYYTNGTVAGNPWTVYQWQGSGSVMTQLDTGGGSTTQALSLTTFSQGSYFWADDANHVELTNRTPLSNSLRLYFVVSSDSGVAVVDVRAWRGSALQEYPITAATLTDPSSGSMSGNTITGLIADNVTVYQVTWQTGTDGFAAGDPYSLILEVMT